MRTFTELYTNPTNAINAIRLHEADDWAVRQILELSGRFVFVVYERVDETVNA